MNYKKKMEAVQNCIGFMFSSSPKAEDLIYCIYRGYYMSVPVLLNLLNKLGKGDKI